MSKKRIKSLKRKLRFCERAIASCRLRGFSEKRYVDARSWYISEIKKLGG